MMVMMVMMMMVVMVMVMVMDEDEDEDEDEDGDEDEEDDDDDGDDDADGDDADDEDDDDNHHHHRKHSDPPFRKKTHPEPPYQALAWSYNTQSIKTASGAPRPKSSPRGSKSTTFAKGIFELFNLQKIGMNPVEDPSVLPTQSPLYL